MGLFTVKTKNSYHVQVQSAPGSLCSNFYVTGVVIGPLTSPWRMHESWRSAQIENVIQSQNQQQNRSLFPFNSLLFQHSSQLECSPADV